MKLDKRMAGDPARDDLLIVVDECGREIGIATKQEVHANGLLHRAFSVVLSRDGVKGTEYLLAKRAKNKYHSGGLWGNSCCSHPRVGEECIDAAYRRVREELGCRAYGLREIGVIVYRAEFDNGLCEHEYDHVFLGRCRGKIAPNPDEVSEVRWISGDELTAELANAPSSFVAWAHNVFAMAMSAQR